MRTGVQTSGIVFLRGKRVTLRPVSKEEVPLYQKWINDPETRRFISIQHPMDDRREEKAYEKMCESQTDIYLVIVANNKPIGLMGLHRIDWMNRTAMTGALIGEANFRGQGYGTEAKMILLHYAFHTLNLRKICSSAIAYNKRSLRYQEKTGYTIEGVRKKQFYRNGRYYDEIQTAVFRENWEPLWQKFRKEYRLPCDR